MQCGRLARFPTFKPVNVDSRINRNVIDIDEIYGFDTLLGHHLFPQRRQDPTFFQGEIWQATKQKISKCIIKAEEARCLAMAGQYSHERGLQEPRV